MKVGVQELMAVLDEEQAEAVIDHRKKLKKPMTAYAAKLLAKRLSQFEDPSYAADYMIEKGWQSIELDWLPKSNYVPRHHQRSALEIARERWAK